MFAFCCQRMFPVFVCFQLALPLCAALAQEEGRPVHVQSEERRKADERRAEDERLRDPRRPTEKAVTEIEKLGREHDLTTSHNQEFFDATRLDAEIKTQKTLDRIGRGETDPHANDGEIFENRNEPLPPHEPGYYKEYVYRPEGAETPGLERVVVGKGGEVYYTPDHYETFQRIK
jgi:guanyl-specific ribonuclease Sa